MKKTITVTAVLFAIVGNAQTPAATKTTALPDSVASESADSTEINRLLDNVTVTAQRPLIKQEIDRIDYDVQADEDSKTQTVMDILRKVPLVTVDGSDEIYVKGDKNFKIYKNGHYDMSLSKNAKNVLKAMPAASVKRIEVITDPGAREDAESGDAILNIVMMDTKKMEGITGMVNSSCNMRTAPSVSAFLTSQFGKAIINVDYGFIHFTDRNNIGKSHTEQTFVKTGNTIMNDAVKYSPGHIHFADISASYDIDSLNLISASFGGYFQKNNRHGNATTSFFSPDGDIFSHYDETFRNLRDNKNFWSGRLDFEHRTRLEGEKLTLSYMFDLSNCDNVTETTYSDIQNAQFDTTMNVLSSTPSNSITYVRFGQGTNYKRARNTSAAATIAMTSKYSTTKPLQPPTALSPTNPTFQPFTPTIYGKKATGRLAPDYATNTVT